VPEAVVQGVVSWIAGVLREKQLEFVLTVAQGVIDAFFDGDLGEWRRRGQQSTSIRALASRLQEEAVMSAMTLYRYLSVYELVERIGGASALGDLAVTHCYAVLPLRDRPEAQLELLQRADEGTWTTRDLEAAVAGVRGSRDAEERRSRRGSLHGELARLGREARALLQRAKAGEGVGSAEQRERTFALVGAAIEGLEGIRQRSYPKGERARTLA